MWDESRIICVHAALTDAVLHTKSQQMLIVRKGLLLLHEGSIHVSRASC